METVSEKFRAARARASRALDDVDRSRATRALAVAVAIATLATLNPTPESFHAVCARGAHAGTSLAEKALPIRATRSWACSNGGFLRAVRLRREAFSVADLFVASIARVRDGSRLWMSRDVGRRAPRVGSDRDARGGRVPRARDRIRVRDARVRRYDRTQGAQSDENARDGPRRVRASPRRRAPRACGAPLGVVVLCAAGWGVAYGMKKLDPLIRFLAAFAPKPRGRRRP